MDPGHNQWLQIGVTQHPLKKIVTSLLLQDGVSPCFILFLVMEIAFDRAVSFLTFVVRDVWKSSPKSVSFADGNSPSPNLLHEWSTVSSILERLVCDTSSEELPIIHSVN